MPTLVGDGGHFVIDPFGFYLGDGAGTGLPLGHNSGTRPFFTIDIDVYAPGIAPVDFALGIGTHAIGTLSLLAEDLEYASTLTYSDAGYRTAGTPVTAYPPWMQEAFELDARCPIDPGQVAATWGWGSVRLVNVDGYFDTAAVEWNADGREVTIRYGEKTWDDDRGIWLDPDFGDLTTIFSGFAMPWLLSEFELEVPLRDPSYWLQKTLQTRTYAGTGSYEGDTELAGINKPYARGTCYNVPLTLIDRTNNIWQYNDGPGTVNALYEGGATTITFQADTSDLYSGSTTAGQYRTDNSRGLVQLGSTPASGLEITADVAGDFSTAGFVTMAANIARYILTEDMAIPSTNIDTASFTDAATDYPYPGGIFIPPGESMDGVTAVSRLLGSMGAKLVPAPDGQLQCFVLRKIPADATPDAYFDEATIIDLVPRAVPDVVFPPPKRIRVAYRHNYTVMKTGVSSSATAARRQYIGQPELMAEWYSGTVAANWRNANDPPPFGGMLTAKANADQVAIDIGELFENGIRSYDVTVPIWLGMNLTFGDYIQITYPFADLDAGKIVQVVGRGIRSADMHMTLTVIT